MKICYLCKEKKEDLEFYKDSHKKDGLKSSCKTCSIILSESYKKRKGREYAKNNRLKQTYGITLEDYNIMFISQAGKCKICSRHQSETKRGFAVDHCHITGKVRALLCHRCNTGLGNFKDNPILFYKAIEYLNEYVTDKSVD